MKLSSKNYPYLLFFFLFSSCGLYRQNVVNTPLFESKNDLQIGGHLSTNGYDAQASYSLTNKIGILLNYTNLGVKRKEYSLINYTIDKHSFGEFGTGYYRKNKNGFTQEYFLLVGQGFSSRYATGGSVFTDSSSATTPYYSDFNSLYYNRYTLQSDFGKTNGPLTYVFTPRLFLLNFYGIKDFKTDQTNVIARTYVWSDLSLTVRYNFLNYFTLSSQMGLTLPVTGIHDSYFQSSPVNLSLGVLVHFNKKSKI